MNDTVKNGECPLPANTENRLFADDDFLQNAYYDIHPNYRFVPCDQKPSMLPDTVEIRPSIPVSVPIFEIPSMINKEKPLYLPVALDLCWRCGYPGHRRQMCNKPYIVFCSRCGLYGTRSCDCICNSKSGASKRARTRDVAIQTWEPYTTRRHAFRN